MVCDFCIPGLRDITWSLEVWQFVSHHFLSDFMNFVTMPYELEMSWNFACWYFGMLGSHVNFSGIFGCVSNLIENFLSVWPNVDFLWVMFLIDLWNSWYVLDGLEILWSDYRHIEVCHGFGLVHLSCSYTVLCLLEVDTWYCALFGLVWACFNLMNLIDLLPIIQMAWNLVCSSCYWCCLTMNSLGIYWNVCELIWVEPFCLVLWGSKLHVLYSLIHEMIMVDDMNMKPLGFAS
jgi:hypothetical protein